MHTTAVLALIAAKKRSDPEHAATAFRFADLAAELRAEILSCYAKISGVAQIRSDGGLTSEDGVSLVSKQVRMEYFGLLRRDAQTTQAVVVDFDFRHVITYIGNLGVVERRALPKKATSRHDTDTSTSTSKEVSAISKDATSETIAGRDTTTDSATRRFVAQLRFTTTCDWYSPRLYDWLACFASDNEFDFGDLKIVYDCALTDEAASSLPKYKWARDVTEDLKRVPMTRAQRLVVYRIHCKLHAAVGLG